jgi:hypothetical protein
MADETVKRYGIRQHVVSLHDTVGSSFIQGEWAAPRKVLRHVAAKVHARPMVIMVIAILFVLPFVAFVREAFVMTACIDCLTCVFGLKRVSER